MESSINELLFALGRLVKAAERGNEEALQSIGYTVVDFAAISLAKNAIETFNFTASNGEAAPEVNPVEPSSTHWPAKCPITRRDFFMEIDGVPTYGGPYDSYTIPEMTGDPNEPFHKRELVVRRYDHDEGGWLEDELETIPLRVVHEDVLNELQDLATAFIEMSLNEEVEKDLRPTGPGWVVTHPRYGKWFISREAVAADWKQDHEAAHPDEPVSEPDEETVDSWFYEQISWYEVSVYGKQLERPNTAAIEVKWLREMANDADGASQYSEIA